MAWTYSGDPASSAKDLVRFLCGDTDSNMPLLTDEEIQYLLSVESNVRKAAQAACERILAILAKEVDYAIGPEKVQASQRLANYKSLLQALKAGNIGANAAPSWDSTSGRAIFDIGMHDNCGG